MSLRFSSKVGARHTFPEKSRAYPGTQFSVAACAELPAFVITVSLSLCLQYRRIDP
jgi:hypothetical protein